MPAAADGPRELPRAVRSGGRLGHDAAGIEDSVRLLDPRMVREQRSSPSGHASRFTFADYFKLNADVEDVVAHS